MSKCEDCGDVKEFLAEYHAGVKALTDFLSLDCDLSDKVLAKVAPLLFLMNECDELLKGEA